MKKLLYIAILCFSSLLLASGEQLESPTSLIALLQERAIRISRLSSTLAELTNKYDLLASRIAQLHQKNNDPMDIASLAQETFYFKEATPARKRASARKRIPSAKLRCPDMLIFRLHALSKEAITYHEDESIRLWDLNNYTEIKAFHNKTELPIRDICIYPQKPHHYIVATDTSLVLFDEDKPVWHAENTPAASTCVLYYTPSHPDTLYSGHKDGSVRVWNIHTGQYLKEYKLFTTPDTMLSLCITEQDFIVATQLKGYMSSKLLTSLASTPDKISIEPESILYLYPQERSKVILAGKDIKIMALRSKNYQALTLTPSNEVTSLVISSTAPYYLLVGLKNGTLELWTLGTSAECKARWTAHQGPVIAVECDTNRIISAGEEGLIKVWNFNDTIITEEAILNPTAKVMKSTKTKKTSSNQL